MYTYVYNVIHIFFWLWRKVYMIGLTYDFLQWCGLARNVLARVPCIMAFLASICFWVLMCGDMVSWQSSYAFRGPMMVTNPSNHIMYYNNNDGVKNIISATYISIMSAEHKVWTPTTSHRLSFFYFLIFK